MAIGSVIIKPKRIIVELSVETAGKPDGFQPWLLFETAREKLLREYGIESRVIRGTEDKS